MRRSQLWRWSVLVVLTYLIVACDTTPQVSETATATATTRATSPGEANTPPIPADIPLPSATFTAEATLLTNTPTQDPVRNLLTPIYSGEYVGQSIYSYDRYINSVAWSPEGSRIVFGGPNDFDDPGGYLSVIDVKTQEILFEQQMPNPVLNIEWSLKGDLIGVIDNQREEILVWSGETYQQLPSIPVNYAGDLEFSHAGDLLAIAGGRGVTIWDLENEVKLYETPTKDGLAYYEAQHIDWSPDDNYVAYTTGSEFYLMNVHDLNPAVLLDYSFYEWLDWSQTGTPIVISNFARGFTFFDPAEDKVVLHEADDAVYEVTLSPNGKILAAVYEERGNVDLIDTESGALIHTLPPHTVNIAWSPVGTILATTYIYPYETYSFLTIWYLEPPES
jgi:WD40 repeat protein